jgi:hypothetical protein
MTDNKRTYDASVLVTVAEQQYVGLTPQPFADRDASAHMLVTVEDVGLETSAHAIVKALEAAAKQARAVLEGRS